MCCIVLELQNCVGCLRVFRTSMTFSPDTFIFLQGDELGYFQYGGSEIVTLFEPGVLKPDADLANFATRDVGQRYGVSTRNTTSVL